MARDNQSTITISDDALQRIKALTVLKAKELRLSKLSQTDYMDILTIEETERQQVK